MDAVLGEMQTDFVPAGIDKGRGLAALMDQLGRPHDVTVCAGGRLPGDGSGRRVALAMGDSISDAGFLVLADQAFAPANAHAALAAQGVEVVRGSYQVGLFQAVTRLLGHRPGSCSLCRAPEVPDAAHDLLALLSVQERPKVPRGGCHPSLLGLGGAEKPVIEPEPIVNRYRPAWSASAASPCSGTAMR